MRLVGEQMDTRAWAPVLARAALSMDGGEIHNMGQIHLRFTDNH